MLLACVQPGITLLGAVKANFTTISAGHFAKVSALDGSVTAVKRPSSSWLLFKPLMPSLQF